MIEKFTEIVARKVTDKIGRLPRLLGLLPDYYCRKLNLPAVSLLIVTDEIQATACKEVVAEIVGK